MFKEWLLKDEKAKVGRPKLASDETLIKAKISILTSLIICFCMGFVFISKFKGVSPAEFAYSLTISKLNGSVVKSTTGFTVKESYDKNSDYVMELTPSDKVKSYQGGYKYILYKLEGSKWIKKDEQIFKKDTKEIKLKVPSEKNKNATYKINLYITNAAKINKSFAPYSWKFVDSSKQEEKYTYKVFTVKGYYSPISAAEIIEAKKNSKTKAVVTTKKGAPREFIINVPEVKYDVEVFYTDESGKKVSACKEKEKTGTIKCKIPNLNRISNVSIKIWIASDIEKYKLSNWKLKTGKDKLKYITNTYLLKPEKTY